MEGLNVSLRFVDVLPVLLNNNETSIKDIEIYMHHIIPTHTIAIAPL